VNAMKCTQPGCKAWAKKGTERCVFHPLDSSEAAAGPLSPPVTPSFTPPTPTPPATRCNVCRALIPAGTVGCPNAALHNPGYTPRGRR
jgi:hypothetical protein